MRETYEQAIAEAEQALFELVEKCDKAQQAYWDAYDRKREALRRLMDLRKEAEVEQ